MYKLGPTYPFLLVVFLTACSSDNGSTSSGGGTAPPTSSAPPVPEGGTPDNNTPSTNQFAGTYSGTVKYTVSGLGISTSDTDSFTVTIDENGKVSVNGTYAGKLSSNSFSISETGTETVSGVTCSGTISVNGSISGSTISGAFPPTTLDCGGLPLEFSGSFSATKN
ncbi:MAG: hypothetical protein GXP09_05195 [Gammaproteobacteria bacterium]|nr:hypothetical protein [Gammaproteobacteria bacterium]